MDSDAETVETATAETLDTNDAAASASRAETPATLPNTDVLPAEATMLPAAPPPELNDDDIGSEPSSPESSTDGASRAADGRLVDLIVELPTHGQKNSLNVAAVAPVMLYEILRQWTTTS